MISVVPNAQPAVLYSVTEGETETGLGSTTYL